MATVRWKLTIEYDGGAYSGWQRQDGIPSIQQALSARITTQIESRLDPRVKAATTQAAAQLKNANLPRLSDLALDGEPAMSQSTFVNGPKRLPIRFKLS